MGRRLGLPAPLVVTIDGFEIFDRRKVVGERSLRPIDIRMELLAEQLGQIVAEFVLGLAFLRDLLESAAVLRGPS